MVQREISWGFLALNPQHEIFEFHDTNPRKSHEIGKGRPFAPCSHRQVLDSQHGDDNTGGAAQQSPANQHNSRRSFARWPRQIYNYWARRRRDAASQMRSGGAGAGAAADVYRAAESQPTRESLESVCVCVCVCVSLSLSFSLARSLSLSLSHTRIDGASLSHSVFAGRPSRTARSKRACRSTF